MGIQGFTKTFEPTGKTRYLDLKDKKVAVDLMTQVYRAALGMRLSATLTGPDGRPTIHINAILLGVILKLKEAGAKQWWVCDFDRETVDLDPAEHHVQLKKHEMQKRTDRKAKAVAKRDQLRKKEADLAAIKPRQSAKELFSDSDSDSGDEGKAADLAECRAEIDKQDRQAFSLERFYIMDVLYMLDMLDIPWVMCPQGYEAEQLCAMATRDARVLGTKMDYVLTPDADAVVFGATAVLKPVKGKKYFDTFVLADILAAHGITWADLVKAGVILGCDLAPKTPRIGPKTVLKKFRTTVLTPEQEAAAAFFLKEITAEALGQIVRHGTAVAFSNRAKYVELINWVVDDKGYNRARVEKAFHSKGLFLPASAPADE